MLCMPPAQLAETAAVRATPLPWHLRLACPGWPPACSHVPRGVVPLPFLLSSTSASFPERPLRGWRVLSNASLELWETLLKDLRVHSCVALSSTSPPCRSRAMMCSTAV